MKLAFVVPTIPGRESLLSRCLYSITSQPGEYRVLVMAGEGKQGDKVNRAAQLVDTSHMTVVDDDDYVTDSYVSLVNEALEDDPDYVGLNVLCLLRGDYWMTNSTHGDHARWDAHDRGPVPKGITRTSIWRDTPMGNGSFNDREWLVDVAGKVQTSAFIDRDLYVYDYWPDGSAYAGTNRVRTVGAWPVDRSRIEVIDA